MTLGDYIDTLPTLYKWIVILCLSVIPALFFIRGAIEIGKMPD